MGYQYSEYTAFLSSIKLKAYVIAGVVGAVIASTFAVNYVSAEEPLPLSPVVSVHADEHACFGQARAAYSQHGPNGQLPPAGTTTGEESSERKKGDSTYKEEYLASVSCEYIPPVVD